MTNLVAISKDDSLVREIDVSSLIVDPKKNGWSSLDYTGDIDIIVSDDLSANLKAGGDPATSGLAIGQIDLFMQNDDNTGTITFKHNAITIDVGNSANFDPTKMNHYLIQRVPYAIGNINEGLRITHIGVFDKKTALEISSPTVTNVLVENATPDELVINLDKNSDISDLTGLSLSFSTGTPKTISSITSGSGTSVLRLQLSGNIEYSDVFSFDYDNTNNIITAGESNLYNLDAGSTNATNNVLNENVVYDLNFETNADPWVAIEFGGSITFDGNCNIICNNGSQITAIKDVITGTIAGGSFVRLTIYDLVINSGSFAVFTYTTSTGFEEEITTGGAEVVVDIPSIIADSSLAIGNPASGGLLHDIRFSRLVVEVIP